MLANGAELGSEFANVDVTAVTAFPDGDVLGDEDDLLLHGFEEFAIPFFMVLFDFANHAELHRDFLETFLLGDFGELRIHIGPFVIFASGGGEEVFRGGTDFATFEVFEPEFGVFLFVVGGL